MSEEITEIDLEALHEAIKAGLAAKFPYCDVDFYERHNDKVKVPSIHFELEGFDRGKPGNTGTEQLEVTLSFSAKVIASYKKGNKLAVRKLAANVALYVESNRFGMPVTPGEFATAAPEEFADEYEAWRVEWEVTGALGESIWNPSGETPTEIHIGQARTVGADFQPDYIQP